jgi:hypothetical protein
MAKKRKPQTSIFIACEGSNTEPLYFEKLKEIMEEDDHYPFALTIYPDKMVHKKPKTDAIGLVNEAITNQGSFDELWVVFDKDGYTKHEEAFKLAKDNKVNIAFSSISFESWVLLHFERNSTAFSKSADIISQKFLANTAYLADYDKSSDYNLYPRIEDKTKMAFANASWLRNWLERNNPGNTIYQSNPYTDVDSLVKKLVLDDKVYEYRKLGYSLTFDKVEITLNDIGGNYEAEIKNVGNASVIWNEFAFYDNRRNKIAVVNSIVLSGEISQKVITRIATSPEIYIEFRNLKLEVDSTP